MQLSIPEIKSHVPHFTMKLQKIDEPIVVDDIYTDLVIDYFYELITIYDGQGEFGEESYFCIILSQKITSCDYQFVSPKNNPHVVTFIFEVTQQCTGINIVQGTIQDSQGVFLLIGVRDTNTEEDTVVAMLLKEQV